MGGKAILLVTIGFGFILSYVYFNISGMATRSVATMSDYAGQTESHNLAVTGANVGLAKFYEDTTWFGSMTQTFSGNTGDLGHLDGSFTISNAHLAGGRVRLQSISSYDLAPSRTIHDTVEVYLDNGRNNSFTLFAYMTQIEGSIWWITGDTVWGRMHSNDRIQVSGSPVFMDKVTTSRGFNPRPGTGSNQAVYKNGYETGVATIDFPSDLSELINASLSGGRRYANDVWIDLRAGGASDEDGYALVRNSAGGMVIDSISLNDPIFNGVILGDRDVHVQGTLDAQLSVASLDDIFIENDVLYANRNTSTTNDLLGLIAEDDVWVADNAANNASCMIDGSIFCRTGSFGAQNYNTRPVSGELQISGSLVQTARGPVGTFSGYPPSINHGFLKRYHYDDRLADPDFRPPFYPGFYTKRYVITNWWESVRIPE